MVITFLMYAWFIATVLVLGSLWLMYPGVILLTEGPVIADVSTHPEGGFPLDTVGMRR